MTDNSTSLPPKESLSSRAANDLRRIVAGEARPIILGFPPFLPAEEIICLECGHLNPRNTWTCAACDAQLYLPCELDSGGYLTITDLLRSGELSAKVHELRDTLLREQSFYIWPVPSTLSLAEL